jgi:hypothetical protein
VAPLERIGRGYRHETLPYQTASTFSQQKVDGQGCPPLEMKIAATDCSVYDGRRTGEDGPISVLVRGLARNRNWLSGREEPLNGSVEPWKNLFP